MERMKVFVEPSAAVGLAVVLYNEQFRRARWELMGKRSQRMSPGRLEALVGLEHQSSSYFAFAWFNGNIIQLRN